MIPYGKQDISQEDIDAVVNVLQSDFITQGPQVPAFENALVAYCHASYAVAVNSATSALHIACKALGVGKGDIVWTSPISFVASANCALYCGADIDFVDIDPVTYNLCSKALAVKLEQAAKLGQLPQVIIPVHMGGQSCDMKAIHELSKKYQFSIIEDASHAISGSYKNDPIGCCRYSNITVFSFHPVKIITTGEGGAALTNSKDLAEKMHLLRSHGITRDTLLMDKEPDGPWYYQQIDLGHNYRMTELQAALGVSQLKRANDFLAKRNQLADRYHEQLQSMPLQLPRVSSDCNSSWHLYIVRLKLDVISISHREVFEKLREKNIGVNLHYIPIHMQPYYQQLGFTVGSFPSSEQYYKEAISIPLFSKMTEQEQDDVIAALSEVLL